MRKTQSIIVVLSLVFLGLTYPLSPGRATLQADNGNFLARCNNCGSGAYPDSVAVHEKNPTNSWAQWTIEFKGDKVAFKSDTGKYLSRCNNCWNLGSYSDSAFVSVNNSDPKAYNLWTPVAVAGGKWAFKSDTGMFLARCRGCVPDAAYPDIAFVHTSSPHDAPWAQWTISYVSFPLGKINLLSDNGKFVARCNNCGPGSYIDSVGVHVADRRAGEAIWTAQRVGDKIALRSNSGKYLTRCQGCWEQAAYPDSAFVHIDRAIGNTNAQWTPVDLKNGKWAFKSDSGMFLARCNNCALGAKSDFAFVHVSSPYGKSEAQFVVIPA